MTATEEAQEAPSLTNARSAKYHEGNARFHVRLMWCSLTACVCPTPVPVRLNGKHRFLKRPSTDAIRIYRPDKGQSVEPKRACSAGKFEVEGSGGSGLKSDRNTKIISVQVNTLVGMHLYFFTLDFGLCDKLRHLHSDDVVTEPHFMYR